MLRVAAAILVLSVATMASAQNRFSAPEPDVADYCMYGGQLYSLGASICVGREVVIKCVRYTTVVNELRDLNANVDDQTRNRPVWLSVPQKMC
jgi:hypothetical protein